MNTVMSAIICGMLLSFYCSAMAESARNETAAQKIADSILQTMTKEDFRNYYKRHHSRIPKAAIKPARPGFDSLDGSHWLYKREKSRDVPNSRIFPGEFEEVKAILITWPYLFFTSSGQTFDGEQVFQNIGLDYAGRIVRITSKPDLSANSEFPLLFAQLAKAIDDNAEVWINVFNAADSASIKDYMDKNNMHLSRVRFFVNPGNSYWYRDCGPVAFYYGAQDSIGFMDFQYYPNRPLDDSIPIKIGRQAGFPVFTTQLEYEGGNILLDGSSDLLTSDAVYTTNADTVGPYQYNSQTNVIRISGKKALTNQQVRDSLSALLDASKLLVVPMLRFDGGTGHIDLYADLWEENTLVLSQMPAQMNKLTDYAIVNKNVASMMAFTKADSGKFSKRYIPFPRKDDGSWYASDNEYEYYTRTYSNHVFVNKTIIQPVFASQQSGDYADLQKDLDSIKLKYPGYTVVPIDMRAFDGMGGAIHCITKQIPADNPVRIIHRPADSSTGSAGSFPISAKAYNKSGIAHVVCKWRFKGDANWNEFELSARSVNDFEGAFTADRKEGAIEYYLEATSNNGKTMDKPITASAGFYTFVFKNATPSSARLVKGNNDLVAFINKPSRGKLYLKTSRRVSNVAFTLFSLSGRAVYSRHFRIAGDGLCEINTFTIPSGVYTAVAEPDRGPAMKEKVNLLRR